MANPVQEQELRVQLTRCRAMERNATDPLARCLLHDIVQDLQRELERECATPSITPRLSGVDLRLL